MTLYFDQDYSSRAVDAIRRVKAGPVESVRSAFPEQFGRKVRVADAQWLSMVGDRGWLAITRDAHVLKRPDELRALLEHGVGAVILRAPTATPFQMLAFVVKRWDWLREIDAGQPRPFVFSTTLDGEPELVDLGAL